MTAQIVIDEARHEGLAPVQGLDPGVAGLVNALRARGHRTCDSGDGKSKFESGEIRPNDGMHLPFAHIFTRPLPACDIRKAVHRLAADLVALGHPEWEVQATYADGLVILQANEPILLPEWVLNVQDDEDGA